MFTLALLCCLGPGCECGGGSGDSPAIPSETDAPGETSGESGPAETGPDSDRDSSVDSHRDTVETGPPPLLGRAFECGDWETQPAPQGHILIRDASVFYAWEAQRVVVGGTAADGDGDGCTELALATYPESGSGTRVFFLPGTLAETVLIEERQRSTFYGEERHFAKVLSVGDLDADGQLDDWVIGAMSYSHASDGFNGAVYVFSEPFADELDEADATMTVWPPADSLRFADSLEVADLDGDTLDDLVIGWFYSVGGPERIAVYGGPLTDGLGEADMRASIDAHDAGQFGNFLSAESDLNADGVVDLVPTSFSSDGNTGAAYVFHGPISGAMSPDDADRVLIGEQSASFTGYGISGGADADLDGYDDLLIPAHGAGKVYLMLGPIDEEETLADAHAIFMGGARLGAEDALSLPQDLDSDGYPDPVFGDSEWHGISGSTRGAHFLFYGPVAGTYDVADADAIFYEEDGTWEYGPPGGFVSSVGDTDGDGYDDLLMGPWGNAPAWLFRGGPR
jgi:hypothetical protein